MEGEPLISSSLVKNLVVYFAALLASGLAGCSRGPASGAVPVADEETFRGVYEVSRDRSAFLPCGSDEQWYVWPGSTPARELRRLTNIQDVQPPSGGMTARDRSASIRRAYAEVRGDTAAATPGRIAPGYERELRLEQVLVVKPAQGVLCQ